jgi:hypothetical protein
MIESLLSMGDAWSRVNCIAICSTLVPLMFALTGATVLALWLPSRRSWMLWTAALAGGCGVLLYLHVLSWLHAGVVHPVTFILPGLSLLCGLVNSGCIWLGRTRTALVRRN